MITFNNCNILKVGLVVLLIAISACVFGQENFEALYTALKTKIEKEEAEPRWPDLTQIEAYIKWMGIKAADRDNARAISLRANQAGNPYWERQFINLALDAQQSGELTIWQGVLRLMRGEDPKNNRPESWSHCVYVAGPNVGERLYKSAVENGFSTEDIVERARCLMRHATNDLEANWLYTDNESFLGHYDAENYQVMPEGDWSADCMRRGEFTTTNQGDPLMPADKAMEWAQQIRDICEFYNLNNEYDDATDLMVQYLKEKQVLCVKPPQEGHQWYIDLAQQYELDKAKEHMDGFYAIIKGKIEKEEKGIRKPVPDAEVEFEAPKDQRTWTTKTDQGGNYIINGAILHKSCGPFILTALGDGCYKQEEVPGPMEEPDKSYELEKNLLLECGVEGYTGKITITKSWDYKKNHDDYSETFIGNQSIIYNGIFKPIQQMEGMEDQPIKIYEASSAVGSWKYNEDRYCEGQGCGKCRGLKVQEYGSGSLSPMTMTGIMITTYSFPTGKKEVADQLAQFGLVNWYDISTPGDRVMTEERSKSEIDNECVWTNRTTTQNLTGTDIRYKLEDIANLKGSVSWSSSRGEGVDVSITNMPDALEGQKPFDPEQDGTDYKYTVSWNLKAL